LIISGTYHDQLLIFTDISSFSTRTEKSLKFIG
jgi:hypothetical protein